MLRTAFTRRAAFNYGYSKLLQRCSDLVTVCTSYNSSVSSTRPPSVDCFSLRQISVTACNHTQHYTTPHGYTLTSTSTHRGLNCRGVRWVFQSNLPAKYPTSAFGQKALSVWQTELRYSWTKITIFRLITGNQTRIMYFGFLISARLQCCWTPPFGYLLCPAP